MSARRCLRLATLIGLLCLATGCAHMMSSELRAKANKELSFPAVRANPEAYLGETVIWGGKVIETLNEPSVTFIRILQTPLDFSGMPREEETSQGRFLAEVKGYVDPEVYRNGRAVTLAGEIGGSRAEPLGDMEYVYPVVKVLEIHLWRQYPLPYGPYPPPSWTWWGNPYGGYPYPWPYFWPYYPF